MKSCRSNGRKNTGTDNGCNTHEGEIAHAKHLSAICVHAHPPILLLHP